jgi:hypothetical protein
MTKPLPPDPENMNDARAEWAAAALRHFQCTTGADDEDALGDLLCDLMHWSDRNTFDFEAAMAHARMLYKDETAEQPALDLALYDAVEIQPVLENKADHSCEPVPDEPHTATFWTVYGHLKTGGVNALVDCYDQPNAEACAAILAKALLVPMLLKALHDLRGDRPEVQGGVCQHCGRDYIADFLEGDCLSDDCLATKARAALAKAASTEEATL